MWRKWLQIKHSISENHSRSKMYVPLALYRPDRTLRMPALAWGPAQCSEKPKEMAKPWTIPPFLKLKLWYTTRRMSWQLFDLNQGITWPLAQGLKKKVRHGISISWGSTHFKLHSWTNNNKPLLKVSTILLSCNPMQPALARCNLLCSQNWSKIIEQHATIF